MDDITSVITRGPGPATLDLAPPGLCGQPPPLRPSGRFRGPTRRGRRCQRLAQQRGHPLTCSTAVASLRTVLRRVDGEGGTHETGRQARRPLALTVGQRARGGEVEGELDARIGRVDPLAAGSAGPAELLGELARGHDEAGGDPGPGGHAQLAHPTRVSFRPGVLVTRGPHEACAALERDLPEEHHEHEVDRLGKIGAGVEHAGRQGSAVDEQAVGRSRRARSPEATSEVHDPLRRSGPRTWPPWLLHRRRRRTRRAGSRPQTIDATNERDRGETDRRRDEEGQPPEMACGAGHDETEGGRPERAPDHPAQEVLHGPRPALRMGGRRERERDEGGRRQRPGET